MSKQEKVTVSGNFDCNYGEAILGAVLDGMGIALKSNWDTMEELNNGSLVRVLPDYVVDPAWSVWAVRSPGPIMPARV